jgi:hypothetical protein
MSPPDFSNTDWVTAQELLASKGIDVEPGQPLTIDIDHADVLQVSAHVSNAKAARTTGPCVALNASSHHLCRPFQPHANPMPMPCQQLAAEA